MVTCYHCANIIEDTEPTYVFEDVLFCSEECVFDYVKAHLVVYKDGNIEEYGGNYNG